MTRTSDIVTQAVQTLNGRLKEIKQSDEDDLGKLADSFDQISSDADHYASLLYRADQALAGQGDDDEEQDDADEPDQEDDDDEEQDTEERKK